jgi:cytochrome c2
MRRLLAIAALPLCLAACGSSSERTQVPGGDPSRGHRLIIQYGCGACHTIPGIRGADARVGPSLSDFGTKTRFVAGQLPATPENTQRWIENPPKIEPGTLMPDLGVTANDARDITAYLFQRT